MKVSVLVASYNRSENLRMFLEAVEKQQVPADSDWEVIVVDNNSTDNTKEMCGTFSRRSPERFVYIFEQKQGKSIALDLAIQKASGNVLVFTDDDCIPDSAWLRTILREFAVDSSLSGLGGRVELYNQDDRPVTIRTFRERIPFSSPDQLFSLIPGCNMAFRREVFDAVGDFDPALGPGTKTKSSEDMDFLYRAFKKGFHMVYTPDVLVYHNHGRKTDAQVRALNQSYVIGRGAFYCKHILKADRSVLKMAYWEISSLIRSLIKERFSGEAAQEQKISLRDFLVGTAYVPATLRWHLERRLTVGLSL
jgi:GT2 family glycosyltransferase